MKIEKLELKHLTPYLPYGLRMKVNDGYGILKGILQHSLDVSDPDSVDSGMYVTYDECNPLLFPLSECEEILNNDDYLCIDSCQVTFCNLWNGKNTFKIYPTGAEWIYASDVYENFYEFLFKYHFDVFGLIDSGVAIDINTIQS